MQQLDPIVFTYKHVPTIKRFSQSRKFLRVLMGPFGSGKSSGCVIELVKWGAKQRVGPSGRRRSRFAVIRNTYRQLEDTTMRTVEQWLPQTHYGHLTEHRYLIDRLEPDLEIELLFRALDRPEHVSNLLSLDLTGAWVNEMREVPKEVIMALRGRVGRFPAVVDGGAVEPGVIGDTNPPDEDNWLYELFEGAPLTPEEIQKRRMQAALMGVIDSENIVALKPDAELFRQPSGRSPKAENLPYLPKDYYAKLMDGASDDFVKVYVDGEYGMIKTGKPVFPEYKESVHGIDIAYLPGVPIYRGWDFGLTPACLFSQLLPHGVWNTFDELVGDDIGIHDFADSVNLHCAQRYEGATFVDTGDPAGQASSAMTKGMPRQTEEQTCFAILRGKGIEIEPGDQTLTLRLESVRFVLNKLVGGRPAAAVHSRCRMLRRGYAGRYVYRRIKVQGSSDRYADVPDKNEFSHPHDANQYVAARLFGAAVRAREAKKPKLLTAADLMPAKTARTATSWMR